MNTTCPRCGSFLRPGRSPAQCEHCNNRHVRQDHPLRQASGSEDSGLIDIRTLSSMLGGPAVRPVTPIPTFGGLAPLAPRPIEQPLARPPTPIARASQTPLHVLLGVLVFGVVGLAGAVVHSANRTADAAPVVRLAEATILEPSATAAVDAPDPEVTTKPAPPAPPEAVEPPVDKAPTDGPRKQPRSVPRPTKPDGEKSQPKPAPVATPSPTKSVDDRESVACLLDPGKCAPKRETPTATTPPPASPADADLPAKLEPADITDGTRAAKASATSRCAALAKGGEIVKIKLSIAGPTGAVLSTSPESDGGNPSLASCCAGELKSAQFKSVQKAQMGAVVTLKF